jgi:hypothetical protein
MDDGPALPTLLFIFEWAARGRWRIERGKQSSLLADRCQIKGADLVPARDNFVIPQLKSRQALYHCSRVSQNRPHWGLMIGWLVADRIN